MLPIEKDKKDSTVVFSLNFILFNDEQIMIRYSTFFGGAVSYLHLLNLETKPLRSQKVNISFESLSVPHSIHSAFFLHETYYSSHEKM